MQTVLPACALLLVLGGVACAPGGSSGSLWALDEAHLEEEMVYRTPDPQRAAQARQYQLQVADADLAADQARLEALLASCPEPRQDRLEPSSGARVRDAVRVRQDPDRSARVGRLAAADWYLRRAATTGQSAFCERARASLTQSAAPEASLGLPDAEVERDAPGQNASAQPLDASADPYRALAAYGLGLVDSVRGPAPLVGHLAAIYGGSVRLATDQTSSPEETVDRVAPGLRWEPDGLYAALRAAR
jgi:hypothetical protein